MSDESPMGTLEHHALFYIRCLHFICFNLKSCGDGSTMKPQDPFPTSERDFVLSDADAKKVAAVEKAWHQRAASITKKKKQKSTNYHNYRVHSCSTGHLQRNASQICC
jgi:hypothetical protein